MKYSHLLFVLFFSISTLTVSAQRPDYSGLTPRTLDDTGKLAREEEPKRRKPVWHYIPSASIETSDNVVVGTEPQANISYEPRQGPLPFVRTSDLYVGKAGTKSLVQPTSYSRPSRESNYRKPAPAPVAYTQPSMRPDQPVYSNFVRPTTLVNVVQRPTTPYKIGPIVTEERSSAVNAISSVGYEKLTMATGAHLKGYSTGDGLIDAFIVDSSKRYRIDPLLIYAQMSQESSFKKQARSNKGATGLMQLMPATARRLGVNDIYDPRQNIDGGVKYMRILMDLFDGDINLALAGYNAGEGAVMKYGYQIPPYNETQDYVRRISARYRSIANQNVSQITRPASGKGYRTTEQRASK